MPARIVVAITQRTGGGCKPLVGVQALELAHCIANIQFVIHFRSLHSLGGAVFVFVFKITIDKHSLSAAIAKIAIQFHSHITRILAEFLHGHTQLIVEQLAIGSITWRSGILGVVVSGLTFGVVEIITRTCRYRPPIGVALILPIGVTGICGEAENHLVAIIIVPVESSIPAVGDGILAIFPIQNLLGNHCAVVVSLLADIHLGIQIEANKKSCGTGFGPLTLYGGIASQAGFLNQ